MANLNIVTESGKTPVVVPLSYLEEFFDESKGINAINIIVEAVAEQLQKLNSGIEVDRDPFLYAIENAFRSAVSNKETKATNSVNSNVAVTCSFTKTGYSFNINKYSISVK